MYAGRKSSDGIESGLRAFLYHVFFAVKKLDSDVDVLGENKVSYFSFFSRNEMFYVLYIRM